jgi:hypothetical protein
VKGKIITLLVTAFLIGTAARVLSDNVTEADELFLMRVMAVITPRLAVALCHDQPPKLKADIDQAVAASGLEELSAEDVCADGLCGKVTGAPRNGRIDLDLLRCSIDSMAKQQIDLRSKMSQAERASDCKALVTNLKKLGRRRPSEILCYGSTSILQCPLKTVPDQPSAPPPPPPPPR